MRWFMPGRRSTPGGSEGIGRTELYETNALIGPKIFSIYIKPVARAEVDNIVTGHPNIQKMWPVLGTMDWSLGELRMSNCDWRIVRSGVQRLQGFESADPVIEMWTFGPDAVETNVVGDHLSVEDLVVPGEEALEAL